VFPASPENSLLVGKGTGRIPHGGGRKITDGSLPYKRLVRWIAEGVNLRTETAPPIASIVIEPAEQTLALGGSHAFGYGGWDGTPLAALLPIDVEPQIPKKSISVTRLQVEPTAAGLGHPATRLLGRPADSPVWRTLPQLTSLNAVYTIKPGATALLTALDPDGREAVILAVAREGQGRTAALTVQDSWMWQMHPKAPATLPGPLFRYL